MSLSSSDWDSVREVLADMRDNGERLLHLAALDAQGDQRMREIIARIANLDQQTEVPSDVVEDLRIIRRARRSKYLMYLKALIDDLQDDHLGLI